MKKLILTILIWVACIHGNEAATQFFQEGNKFYEKSNFDSAVVLYQKAINEGLIHPTLYYNYANGLFRNNQLGLSILYYEKALKLSPSDPDILNNLKYAKAQRVDKHPEQEHNALTKILILMHNSYSLNTALWMVLLVFSGLFLTLIIQMWTKGNLRWLTYPVMTLSIIFLVLASPFVIYKLSKEQGSSHAIVINQVIAIYSGPGDSYELIAKVHEGTKFEIHETANGWVKVMLPNGTGGYVSQKDLGRI